MMEQQNSIIKWVVVSGVFLVMAVAGYVLTKTPQGTESSNLAVPVTQPKVLVTSSLPIAVTESTLPASTTDIWSTYNGSDSAGVTIEYPSTWHVFAQADSVSFRTTSDPSTLTEVATDKDSIMRVLVDRKDNQLHQSARKWFDTTMRPLIADRLSSEKYTSIDGYDAVDIEISEVGGKYRNIYVLQNVDVIEISYPLYAPQFVPIYEKMLQSVTFTSPPKQLPDFASALWPKFKSIKYGLSLSYPDFDQKLNASLSKQENGEMVLDVSKPDYKPALPQSQYAIIFDPNLHSKTLEQWFAANVDSSGRLIAGGTFTLTTLRNGVVAYVLSGGVADGYDGGPIPGVIYAISPSGKTIMVVSVSQDHQLGSTSAGFNSITESLLTMLGTAIVP